MTARKCIKTTCDNQAELNSNYCDVCRPRNKESQPVPDWVLKLISYGALLATGIVIGSRL